MRKARRRLTQRNIIKFGCAVAFIHKSEMVLRIILEQVQALCYSAHVESVNIFDIKRNKIYQKRTYLKNLSIKNGSVRHNVYLSMCPADVENGVSKLIPKPYHAVDEKLIYLLTL